jgi:CDP-glucose 4,6-dehydratase
MHYFLTGHTGFKGSWLIALLRSQGHEVSGYALEPLDGGLFTNASLEQDLKHHTIGDIRDISKLRVAVVQAQPDVVIHLAAQPLVLRSYEDPIETYTTNVTGTLNLLEVVTEIPAPPVTLVVTTDKVYKDTGKGFYSESDPLGGHDPYSASKSMADILTQSWSASQPNLRIGVARAGNVIGAFDVSRNRLVPDIISAITLENPILIRHADAIRPWQHVLDCLRGYLTYSDSLGADPETPSALNFGPREESNVSVGEIVRLAQRSFPDLKVVWQDDSSEQPKETGMLTLDSSLAQAFLGWRSHIDIASAMSWSLVLEVERAREVIYEQVDDFLKAK